MKFFQFFIAALLLTLILLACEKDKDVIPVPVQPNETPGPIPEVKSVQGTWMGVRAGFTKSIPVYFGFQVKEQGKLDVINTVKEIIGTGTWRFDNEVFTGTYTISISGVIYSVKSTFYNKPSEISGTWGIGINDSNGGTWSMDKIN